MPRKSRFSKDHYGAALLILMGLGALMEGIRYHVGSPNRMGAGFVPVVLGTILALVGVAIAVTAGPDAPPTDELHKPHPPEWRGWSCILGGVIAFVVFGVYGGLVPATFASVFIAALGDRKNTVKNAFWLAMLMVVFGVLIFSYGLRLQLPLFTWG